MCSERGSQPSDFHGSKVEGCMKIALLGNHSVSFSTERELDWTLEERLGHEVVRLQENNVTTEDVISACRERAVGLRWRRAISTTTWCPKSPQASAAVGKVRVRASRLPAMPEQINRLFVFMEGYR